MPDSELLRSLRQREHAAFEQLYAKNRPAIYRYVQSNSGSMEDAEDVLQEAILILYKKISQPDFQLSAALSTFLFGIAKRLWLRNLKIKPKKWVTQSEESQLIQEQGFEDTELAMARQRLYRKKIKELGKDCQQVLTLFFQRVSMEEIAKKLGYGSVQYAKKKKFTCKEKLIKKVMSDPLYKELKG